MARGGTAVSGRRQVHADWLKLIEVGGPFMSAPVLTAEWPNLESINQAEFGRLRLAHRDWLEIQGDGDGDGDWIRYVLEELLEWQGSVSFEVNEELPLPVPEHDAVIVPSFTLADSATGDIRLLGMISEDSPRSRIQGSDWSATPADRLAQLCRARKVELGLATDGRWWCLVWASPDGITSTATWDAISWPDPSERAVLRAFISLLQRRRFFAVPADRQLPALLRRSLDNQEELTERLGVQVHQAVEMLVAAFGRNGMSPEVAASDVYKGAVIVLMRVVFLLYAEAIGLLPADNELYAAAYSISGLHAALEERVAEARGNEAELDHTFLAWHRLLALFTAIDRGVRHPQLEMQAYDGTLFDPKRHSWMPLAVDDRTVLHMLRAVQTVTIGGERRTVSFSTLQVEQIGYVYEGLLSFGGYRATEVIVGLTGREGREAEVPLSKLEALFTGPDPAARIVEAFRDSGIGTVRGISSRLVPLAGEERAIAETKLYAVTREWGLVSRLLPVYPLLRQDLRGDPVVILPGQLYVTESTLRAATGTHYTPAFLAKEIAEGALEPLVFSPGPLQTADRSQWMLLPPEGILALRVADIAAGSGAFLVAACRYLADCLVEAWSIRGIVDRERVRPAAGSGSEAAVDTGLDQAVIDARRLVIEHCLYGVDINEMAVEMAKMSLWIISMDKSKPFTFLDDKLAVGDSLLGITAVEQLEWMHLDPAAGRVLHEDTLFDFTAGVRDFLAEAGSRRRALVEFPDDIDGVHKKRAALAEVVDDTRHLRRYANLVAGAALVRGGKQGHWAAAAKHADEAFALGKEAEAVAAAKAWLATDKPDGAFDREPLHWPLTFPEVFGAHLPEDNRGFDAVIGNPPYLGGQKLTGMLGTAYREDLVSWVGRGARGSADLVAYFFLRAHDLLSKRGQAGLIATNTIAQGDTREVGLDQIVAWGAEIRQAVKSRRWPSKSAILEYAAVWTSHCGIGPAAPRWTPSLDRASRISGNPKCLVTNAGISFQGTIVLGLGFTMKPERALELIARDARNKDVLFPYLNGQDLNSRPDCSASRWVINFHDWPADQAATYVEPYVQVLREVKPVRDGNNRKVRRERWWQFAERATGLYNAIAHLDRVIAITLVSRVTLPVMVPKGQVFSHKLGIFASDDTGLLALLSSAHHYWWAISRSSTMKADLNYSPSDVFETMPLPDITPEIREFGNRLDSFRRDLMLSRQAGLTVIYNSVHNPICADADIAELRAIHRAIDEAVTRAYGWADLLDAGLDHGFHDTRQGTRYTIASTVRQEVLDRLLELNHARYAAEVQAGLHAARRSRKIHSHESAGNQTIF
jgi:hypothetical protein